MELVWTHSLTKRKRGWLHCSNVPNSKITRCFAFQKPNLCMLSVWVVFAIFLLKSMTGHWFLGGVADKVPWTKIVQLNQCGHAGYFIAIEVLYFKCVTKCAVAWYHAGGWNWTQAIEVASKPKEQGKWMSSKRLCVKYKKIALTTGLFNPAIIA